MTPWELKVVDTKSLRNVVERPESPSSPTVSKDKFDSLEQLLKKARLEISRKNNLIEALQQKVTR